MTGPILLLAFLILVLAGVRIAYAMGVTAVVALILLGIPTSVFLTRSVASVNSFSLLAIPFFVIAGDLLTAGGISRRIITLAESFFGWMRGGLGVVNVGSSVLFAGVSGSAAADTAAVGGVLIPEMKRAGYRPGFAAAVTAVSSTIGPIIPPSLLMIIYGGITGVSIGSLFIAGILPGILLGLTLMLIAWWIGRKQASAVTKLSLKNILSAARQGILGIFIPVIIIGGILFGVFTATEAGVIVLAYSYFVAKLIYRELSHRDFVGVMVRSAVLSGVLMLIVAMAASFAWILAYANTPGAMVEVLTTLSDDPTVVMLLVIVLLLIVGMFVETIAAMIITVPVLFPLGEEMGFDPIHFALVIMMTLLIGTVTPPLGVLLYVAAGIGKVSVASAIKESVPFVIVMIATVIVVALFPALVTWLPSLQQ
jgi:C4-dicarboxylate transporter DctM subunit